VGRRAGGCPVACQARGSALAGCARWLLLAALLPWLLQSLLGLRAQQSSSSQHCGWQAEPSQGAAVLVSRGQQPAISAGREGRRRRQVASQGRRCGKLAALLASHQLASQAGVRASCLLAQHLLPYKAAHQRSLALSRPGSKQPAAGSAAKSCLPVAGSEQAASPEGGKQARQQAAQLPLQLPKRLEGGSCPTHLRVAQPRLAC